MSRRAVRPGPPTWRQAGVLAAGTWRLAWREPLTRLLLALAMVLAVIGAVAAIGSPGAGNGAVQMLAVCLQVVPFALVLLAGDVWRGDAEEIAVFARPVDAMAYVFGRAAGLCLVGLGLLGATGGVSILGLWLIARLPLLPDIAWVLLFCLVYVAPGLLLLTGACLWHLARGGAGPRYHATVIVAALLVAFYQYKLEALAGHARALAFFAPFPGFLTLGLVLPPPLLGAAAVPGWLWLNRLLALLCGLLLLLLAGRRRSSGFPRVPLRRARLGRTAIGLVTVVAAGCAAALLAAVPRLAPAVAATAPRVDGPDPAPAGLVLHVAADAATGRLRGEADWSLAAGGRVDVLLNAGLRLQAPGGRITRPAGGRLVPGTAARLYQVSVPAGGQLVLDFSGRLLPVPSTLPYPPFPAGQPVEGAALGGGRAFFNGSGTWYPRIVGPGLRPAAPGTVTLHLQLTGSPDSWVGVSTADYRGPVLPPVLGASAPYRTYTGAGWRLLGSAPPSPAERAVLGTYAVAATALRPTLPGDFGPGPELQVAVSPLLTAPLLSGGTLWIPGDQPFCVPGDAVVGTCASQAPTLTAATLLLARLAWQARLELPGGGPALPLPAAAQAAAGDLAPRAAVSAWQALGDAADISAAWTKGTALPVLGNLSPAQRTQAAALAAG